ncbi:serine hydrolase domain-containing protein [Flagellimonas allohymeniacidonis]|uniref:Class A beta-lactamase-related serine hydrolase n=1 Tax=Flagellimonas allohymeniacidonis TaxID=2517819 RepID=A0A4Q8QFF6_9FLAO|nr:serine hydrolase domain-containing protein [Allomuricauda hymeniacidonis]TAI49161.1 class A beta-lactamase-related serine hydrolase [Allomuricauda hymeniacidonis]
MKKFKLTKFTRRLLRVFGTLFVLWLTWSIYYYSTWTMLPEEGYPITEEVSNPEYQYAIREAKTYLIGVSKRLDVPSFSVAVGHNGKVIWSAAEGYADLENRTSASTLTQYRVGSTSKAITTTGIAKLVNKGGLNLDEVIGDTIRNWTRKKWDFTLRQLLSHTAGIGNYEDFGLESAKYTLCNCNQFDSASEGLKVFDQYPLLHKPGSGFKYSTFDINLSSVVLEQAAGHPFLDYMQTSIFDNLDMDNTYGDHAKPKTEYFATFYQTSEGYYREYRTMGIRHDVNLSYKWAGGGFISTPTDLVKLGNAWLSDSSFLSMETKKEFWTPVKLSDGAVNEQEYALGWRSWLKYESESLIDGKPIWMVHHGGVSKGSMNFLVLFPEYNLVIDASINARVESFADFADEVKKIANCFLKSIPKKESELFQEITEHL